MGLRNLDLDPEAVKQTLEIVKNQDQAETIVNRIQCLWQREGLPWKIKAQAGEVHPVDQAFHDLAISQRNRAWREIEDIKSDISVRQEKDRGVVEQAVFDYLADHGPKLNVSDIVPLVDAIFAAERRESSV